MNAVYRMPAERAASGDFEAEARSACRRLRLERRLQFVQALQGSPERREAAGARGGFVDRLFGLAYLSALPLWYGDLYLAAAIALGTGVVVSVFGRIILTVVRRRTENALLRLGA
jgi:hypothetical protein